MVTRELIYTSGQEPRGKARCLAHCFHRLSPFSLSFRAHFKQWNCVATSISLYYSPRPLHSSISLVVPCFRYLFCLSPSRFFPFSIFVPSFFFFLSFFPRVSLFLHLSLLAGGNTSRVEGSFKTVLPTPNASPGVSFDSRVFATDLF